MIIFLSFVIGCYFFAMFLLFVGYMRLRVKKIDYDQPETRFTVIIPFRDEAGNLPELIHSITALNYPKDMFEVLFIDDESSDNSKEMVNDAISANIFIARLLTNVRRSLSPKKDAISLAVSEASNEWIVTTDADCVLPAQWLRAYDQVIRSGEKVFVAGPVNRTSEGSWVGSFQELDGLTLQFAAMASFGWKLPLLCNGANMCYKKAAFEEVDGYAGNDKIASGDDVFLLEKFKARFPTKLSFLKSPGAIVLTRNEENWTKVIQQRIRWASKTLRLSSLTAKLLGIVVFLTNAMFLSSIFLIVLPHDDRLYYIAFALLKLILDSTIIYTTAGFFNKRINPIHFLLNFLIYPLVTVVVVINSLTGRYTWKGRSFVKQV